MDRGAMNGVYSGNPDEAINELMSVEEEMSGDRSIQFEFIVSF